MKSALDHLPPQKRDQIQAIAALVQASAPVDKIILFGSYARGDWVEDPVGGYFSDIDVMVVVGTEALARDASLWTSISARSRSLTGRASLSLIVHDIKQLNQEIRTGQYFFSDVVNEGILLFDSKRYQLARPKAQTPGQRLALALRNFRYWYESASEFWRGTGYYAARELGPHAAFLLHQATERYFHAVLLVYTGYKPKTHDIASLADQTAPLHEALAGALPRAPGEDERLFLLLKRAYIEARYSKSYRITAAELAILQDRVLDVAVRVRQACVDKLTTLAEGGNINDLPAVPTPTDPFELPSLPALDDPAAVRAWHDAITRRSYEKGEIAGRREGRREGELIGRQEGELIGRARALLDVLRRRGLDVTDADAARILACDDDATLSRWWDLAWTATTTADLWA